MQIRPGRHTCDAAPDSAFGMSEFFLAGRAEASAEAPALVSEGWLIYGRLAGWPMRYQDPDRLRQQCARAARRSTS